MLPLLQLCIPSTLLARPVSNNEGLMKSIVLFTANIARNSLVHLQNRNFKQFDALVGENTCQLRAYHVQRNGNISNERINHLLMKIDALSQHTLETVFPVGQNGPGGQIGQYVNRLPDELQLKLTEEEKYLILSHMLCVVREPVPERADQSESSHLEVFLHPHEEPLDGTMLTDIMFVAKRSLSELSAKYAQQLALELDDRKVDHPIKRMLYDLMGKKNQKTNEIHGHSALIGVSCFFSILIILEHLQENKGALVIRVKRAEGFVDIPILEGKGPRMIVEGISENLNEEAIQQQGIEIIMVNAACHPQYFGAQGNNVMPLLRGTLSPLAAAHQRLYLNYKARGEQVLPLFQVKHIYCEGG